MTHLPDGFAPEKENDFGAYGRDALIYEVISSEESLKPRSVDGRSAMKAVRPDSFPGTWPQVDDVDRLLTRTHLNKKFDDLQRNVCGAVSALHSEVAAIRGALIPESIEYGGAAKPPVENLNNLVSEYFSGNLSVLSEILQLISEYEIRPEVDMSNAALEALASDDDLLRAAAASALGVLKPQGATAALGMAFETERNRHIKKIIGGSLKANIA